MRLPISLAQQIESLPHVYRVFALDSDYGWLSQLSKEYQNLLVETDHPLEEISVEGIAVIDPSSILARIRAANVPTRSNKPNNFDVVRSDFGETLCYIILEDEYNTVFGYKSVRDRELTQSPGRGIDAIGIEENNDGTLTLVLAEVKVSDEATSPPQVVDSSKDCLRQQHLNHVSNLSETVRKIWNISRHSRKPSIQRLFIQAAIYLQEGILDSINLIAFCLLVRPESRYSDNDFGTFIKSPQDFDPAKVRFIVVCVPDEVNPVISRWYEEVQNSLE